VHALAVNEGRLQMDEAQDGQNREQQNENKDPAVDTDLCAPRTLSDPCAVPRLVQGACSVIETHNRNIYLARCIVKEYLEGGNGIVIVRARAT
jgi:hypothetical protein